MSEEKKRAPQDGDEGYCECGDCERTRPNPFREPSLMPETDEYVKVTLYLESTEAQDWSDGKGVPLWTWRTVQQALRKVKATS